MTRLIHTHLMVVAEVDPGSPEGLDGHALADSAKFHLGISDLDSIEADISAMKIVQVVEKRGIQPGDLVEPRDRDLDPREVISVGSDFLTLDLMGKESPRVPKDNYVITQTCESLDYYDLRGQMLES